MSDTTHSAETLLEAEPEMTETPRTTDEGDQAEAQDPLNEDRVEPLEEVEASMTSEDGGQAQIAEAPLAEEDTALIEATDGPAESAEGDSKPAGKKPRKRKGAKKRKTQAQASAEDPQVGAEAQDGSEETLPGSEEALPGSEGAQSGAEEAQPASEGTEPADSAADGQAELETADGEEAEEPKVGPGESLTEEELIAAVSALIFASPDPLGTGRIATLLEGPRRKRIQAALEQIQSRLTESGLPLELREIAGGWRLMTSPEAKETVARLVKARKADKLSPAGLETLAVVAYRQPVTKADIEAIRGVQCGAMLRNLVDRGLAKVTGRADVPGAPLQYGTTKEFLDRFGMGSLKDLPRDGELLKE